MSDPPSNSIETLQAMPLFGGIRADILRLILDTAATVCIEEGGYFFREGDIADAMFVLRSGSAGVYKQLRGQDRLLRKLESGDCFGEMALLDLLPRSASVRAMTSCTALAITPACIAQVHERDVEQFALIEMNIGRELSRRLRETDAALDPERLPDREGIGR